MPITKKASRRGRLEGSIYKRSDGKWTGQVHLGYNDFGKPIRKYFYGKTRDEVSRKVTEATNDVFSGRASTSTKRIAISKLVREFLWTFKKPSVSDTTFEWYRNLSDKHIVPEIGQIVVSDAPPRLMQGLFNRLHMDKKLSVRTVKAVRDLLNQIFFTLSKQN